MFVGAQKGGKICVNIKEPGCYVQCQHCGKIYQVNYKIPIDVLMVKSACPECRHDIALNLGDKPEDVYEFININVDPRCY